MQIIGCPKCPGKLSVALEGPVITCAMCGRSWESADFMNDHADHIRSELDEQRKEKEADPANQIRHARNLLAVIHRDGGHYTEEHGFEKACKDAEKIVINLRGKVDGLEHPPWGR